MGLDMERIDLVLYRRRETGDAHKQRKLGGVHWKYIHAREFIVWRA